MKWTDNEIEKLINLAISHEINQMVFLQYPIELQIACLEYYFDNIEMYSDIKVNDLPEYSSYKNIGCGSWNIIFTPFLDYKIVISIKCPYNMPISAISIDNNRKAPIYREFNSSDRLIENLEHIKIFMRGVLVTKNLNK